MVYLIVVHACDGTVNMIHVNICNGIISNYHECIVFILYNGMYCVNAGHAFLLLYATTHLCVRSDILFIESKLCITISWSG